MPLIISNWWWRALIAFAAFFGVMSLYVPFYFGGGAMTALMAHVFKDETVAETFVGRMGSTLSGPFLFFKTVSIGTAVIALISLAATIIIAVRLVIKAVEYVYDLCQGALYVKKKLPLQEDVSDQFLQDKQSIYKLLLQLRN